MLKKSLVLGLSAGILAGIASIVYANIYKSALGADFSKIAQPVGMILSSVLGCMLASVAYYFSARWLKNTGEIIFNLVFVLLSFASILGPFAAKLPLDVDMPELFVGLTVPMHFFPALAWFTLKPLFIRPEKRTEYDLGQPGI
jgi:hypothetical protein